MRGPGGMLVVIGRRTAEAVEYLGYVGVLLWESLFWMVMGRRRGQPVKASPIFAQMMQVGVEALAISSVLAITVGIMLSIQLISTLAEFGAESQVVLAVAVSITREFAPLITGILIAGRSGSALAARIGSMVVSQEIDALRVIGIEPVRYLVVPAMVALVIMLPVLVIFADALGIIGAGLYSAPKLDMSLSVYIAQSIEALDLRDIMEGLSKALVFGIIIALVGVTSGFMVRGGAEGVGRATTRAVVLSISWIVIADMIFTFFLNR